MSKDNNFLMQMYCGDTLLDIYGYEDKDDYSTGHIGGIDLEDVRIANTDISVWEMIHALDYHKFCDQAHQSWGERNYK
jgi:hypothetical protein